MYFLLNTFSLLHFDRKMVQSTHLSREHPCSSIFIAVYLPPQTDAGTKSALNELYRAIRKQENAHPETALLVAGDFNAGKLKYVLPNLLPFCHLCN